MPIQQTELHKLLREAFPDAAIEILDLAGDNDHYQVSITSSQFIDKNRVQQHQMVYKALSTEVNNIHALSLKTQAPNS